ncbi:hypothetical protein As57867_006731, partial [Aphanomyces stellatus]
MDQPNIARFVLCRLRGYPRLYGLFTFNQLTDEFTSAQWLARSTTTNKCTPLESNVDYPGNDLASTNQVSADFCCADCDATVGCTAYVWTSFNNGTCWLKHSLGPKTVSPGASAGSVQPQNDLCTPVEANVDYVGNDLTLTQRPSVNDCCSDCDKTVGCNAYVWTNYNGGTCWLKSSQGDKVYVAGAFAASMVRQRCNAFEDSVDYVGHDLTSTSQMDASLCCNDCQNTPGC